MSNSIEPHVIRLRGPWDYEPLFRAVVLDDGSTSETTEQLPPPGRIQMPSDWGDSLGSDFRGRVRYLRRFGCPTGLTASHRVMLVVEQVIKSGHVELNGESLGTVQFGQPPARYDVARLIDARNELTIDVVSNSVCGGVIGEVRLEIFACDS